MGLVLQPPSLLPKDTPSPKVPAAQPGVWREVPTCALNAGLFSQAHASFSATRCCNSFIAFLQPNDPSAVLGTQLWQAHLSTPFCVFSPLSVLLSSFSLLFLKPLPLGSVI